MESAERGIHGVCTRRERGRTDPKRPGEITIVSSSASREGGLSVSGVYGAGVVGNPRGDIIGAHDKSNSAGMSAGEIVIKVTASMELRLGEPKVQPPESSSCWLRARRSTRTCELLRG